LEKLGLEIIVYMGFRMSFDWSQYAEKIIKEIDNL
jgi:hypothetical protein